MSQSFSFGDVDLFTMGAIGEPGRRVFLLQFCSGEEIVTLKVEKQQVAALCAYLGELLADAPSPGHLPEELSFRSPLDVAWAAGSITVTYDEIIDRMVIAVEEADFNESSPSPSSPDAEPGGTGQFSVTREQAAAAAIHGTSIVAAGRPPCPLCGHPLDPEGHACPRTNGHRAPQL